MRLPLTGELVVTQPKVFDSDLDALLIRILVQAALKHKQATGINHLRTCYVTWASQRILELT